MMSPRERYQNDARFHSLVKLMVAEIEKGNFTPTEMREAALLAHVIYNENYVGIKTLPYKVNEWLIRGPEDSADKSCTCDTVGNAGGRSNNYEKCPVHGNGF